MKDLIFQSTLPVGGATIISCDGGAIWLFQSTLPVGGATTSYYDVINVINISIHAPRGGSDVDGKDGIANYIDFNPRSPWGERLCQCPKCGFQWVFQSTLPVGGATSIFSSISVPPNYFNPRSPWGERLLAVLVLVCARLFQSTLPVGGATTSYYDVINVINISIHAPRGGSDPSYFFYNVSIVISIHAPRGGSDRPPFGFYHTVLNFNPRSPWGERPITPGPLMAYGAFQSTLPVGGATWNPTNPTSIRQISIHAPRGGSDAASRTTAFPLLYFNPRSPWGERPLLSLHKEENKIFQSTLPVGGATRKKSAPIQFTCYFNPRSPWGERHVKRVSVKTNVDLQ